MRKSYEARISALEVELERTKLKLQSSEDRNSAIVMKVDEIFDDLERIKIGRQSSDARISALETKDAARGSDNADTVAILEGFL